MDTRQRILLVDDDPDLCDLYREILAQLPSRPEIHTVTSGPHALAMLEAEPFDLLICDLKMPKMDGFQVLEIVRSKYPQLRTMVLTVNTDEQFRRRAYAMGVDLFCDKPATEEETKVWLEQVESLLGRQSGGNTLTAQPHRTNPLRIVMVNDEPGPLQSFEIIIRGFFKDLTLLMFENPADALEELSRTDPDLLITDDKMAGMNGEDLCRRLLAKKVSYPIIVDSPWEPTEEWVREFAKQGLNVSFLPLPCDVASLRKLMEACLRISGDLATPDETKTITNQTKTPKPRGKLLIVDDEDAVRQCMHIVFKDEYDCFIAEEGQTAIELAKQNDIDVVVTNISMPGMSGIKLLERLKFMKPDIEVIMMTGFDSTDTIQRALQLRASDYITKPFDCSTMRAAVSKAMQHRTLESKITAVRKQSSSNMEKVADRTLLKRRGKLLIVDDEDGVRQAMRLVFKDEYDCFLAGDGTTAIELAKQNDIDVVVTNINMPGMSGIELLGRLKILKPDIEVIIATACETTDTLLQALRLGACDYIYKPFDFSTMHAAISKAMQHRTL